MKRILSVALVLVMTLSLLAIVPFTSSAEVIPNMEWAADENGEYHIKDAGDMLAFFIFATDFANYKDATVYLDADIDMTDVEWFPLPLFEGTLDGQGHAIRNLVMEGDKQLAFAKVMNNATVKNIAFVDGTITAIPASGAADAAVVTICAKGVCTFENVYTRMTVNTGTTARASGMISYANADGSKAVFKNCVSASTVTGARASGFVAQVMINSSVELTDCAFVGDLSAAGTWSSAFTGLTTGGATLTRCISLGKEAGHNASGGLVFLDDQNARWTSGKRYETTNQYYEFISVISITDCYAAVNALYPVGLESGSQKRVEGYDFTLTYGGQQVFHKDPVFLQTVEDDKAVQVQIDEANLDRMYLAKEGTVTLTADNFATLCPGFTDWTVLADETVAYGPETNMVVVKVLPTACVELIDAADTVPTPPAGDGDGEGEGEGQQPGGDGEGEGQQPGGSDDEGQQPGGSDNEGDNTTSTTASTTAPATKPAGTQAPATTTEEGCASVIGGSAAVILAIVCGAAVVIRKKED